MAPNRGSRIGGPESGAQNRGSDGFPVYLRYRPVAHDHSDGSLRQFFRWLEDEGETEASGQRMMVMNLGWLSFLRIHSACPVVEVR